MNRSWILISAAAVSLVLFGATVYAATALTGFLLRMLPLLHGAEMFWMGPIWLILFGPAITARRHKKKQPPRPPVSGYLHLR